MSDTDVPAAFLSAAAPLPHSCAGHAQTLRPLHRYTYILVWMCLFGVGVECCDEVCGRPGLCLKNKQPLGHMTPTPSMLLLFVRTARWHGTAGHARHVGVCFLRCAMPCAAWQAAAALYQHFADDPSALIIPRSMLAALSADMRKLHEKCVKDR